MSSSKETLLEKEKILYHTKPHYIVFYRALVWLALALFIYKLTANVLVAAAIFLMGLGVLAENIISYFCSEYVITNKRVLMKTGFIRRKSLEIFLDRVEGAYIEQVILGRILNFGTVIINGIGGTKNPFFIFLIP